MRTENFEKEGGTDLGRSEAKLKEMVHYYDSHQVAKGMPVSSTAWFVLGHCGGDEIHSLPVLVSPGKVGQHFLQLPGRIDFFHMVLLVSAFRNP